MGGSQLQSQNRRKGRLFIVGTGPGNPDLLTLQALYAIKESDYIIGNTFYLNLIGNLLEDKKIFTSTMGREVERAKKCIMLAKENTVAIVSGGDPGIYGMASIVLEVLEHENVDIDVEIIPGVTAATAGASRLGSPLSGDFITISLSDLLTPLEVILERLHLAFQMGIPVTLYNPKSRGRKYNLSLALDIALEYISPKTPVGIVKNAFREEEEVIIMTLKELHDNNKCVDMHSIVIIGGEETRFMESDKDVRGIITPRGYHRKYVY